MGIFARIRDALSFNAVPTTVVAVLIYVIIFAAVLYTDELPDIPKEKKWKGLNLTRAYDDLHAIAARPHPFITRANDQVRDYILSRVNAVASAHPGYVTVDDDLRTNAAWAGGTPLAPASAFGVYFEGTNVLVKIDGTLGNTSSDGAVLFSAHYDSVSTASGATDDGMGVATLLALIDYLAKHRPKRTAIFNINNGEEDGLNGAHIFMEHPWSKLTKTFLNLEGAAAGGRPILFRATSLSPARSYYAKHPHTNALAADGFKSGLIKSATDYSVYAAGNGSASSGLEGLDFAFYKGRAKYHTKWDAIPHTMGGKKALWAMMETSRATADELLNGKRKGGAGDDAVYFDFLGLITVVFPLTWLLATDIVLLVVGPIAVLALLLTTVFRVRRERRESGQPAPQTGAKDLILALLGWARFWVALAVTAVALFALCLAYIRFNPYAIHSRTSAVLLSALSLSYLALVLPLQISHFRPSQPPSPSASRQQKLATLLESYILVWGLTLASTVAVARAGTGATYVVTFWHAGALLGTLLALLEAWTRARTGAAKSDVGSGNAAAEAGDYPQRVLVRGVRFDADGTGTGARRADDEEEDGHAGEEVRARDERTGRGVIVETEPTEITPLIHQHRSRSASPSPALKKPSEEEKTRDELLWWFFQMLLVVPIPVLLLSQIGLLAVDSLAQTLIDGSAPSFVYGAVAFLSFLILLPLAPFAHKLHRALTITMAVVFVVSTAYTMLSFPFTPAGNLKVYFSQSVELSQNHGAVARTYLAGVPPFVDKYLVRDLPSTRGKRLDCNEVTSRGPAVPACAWDSTALLPSPGRTDAAPKDWIDFSATRTNATHVRFTLSGLNTRACRLYFDERSVSAFHVRGSGVSELRRAYPMPEGGVRSLRLWSRKFGKGWTVDVAFAGAEEESVSGRVACEWAEYESGAAGGKGSGGRIPAYEEVLAFLPDWALATKTNDGLVEAWMPFKV